MKIYSTLITLDIILEYLFSWACVFGMFVHFFAAKSCGIRKYLKICEYVNRATVDVCDSVLLLFTSSVEILS